MFPIVKTLVFILHALGIPTWFSIFALDQPLIIDETLFRDTANINKFKFTNIAYFFFCLLDYQRADYCFGPLMPIENEAQYDLFVKKLVAWLKELSITFELLRYVPLSEAVFQDCSGPVMHQVMFAFAMAVVKYKIFIGGGKIGMILNLLYCYKY
jgi:hypothetical protein